MAESCRFVTSSFDGPIDIRLGHRRGFDPNRKALDIERLGQFALIAELGSQRTSERFESEV